MLKDIAEVENKLVALANALSLEQYAWRAAQGVRSVQEVLMHVAADKYFIPAAIGVAAPAATKTTVAALKTSFAHLRSALSGIPEAKFGQTSPISNS